MLKNSVQAFMLAGALCAFSVSGASAQGNPTGAGFKVGSTDVGPVIGLGGLAGAGLGFGGRFEKGFKELPDLGDGVLGIGAAVDWFHYSNSFVGTSFGFTYIPISVTVNYHFQLANKQIDPFVGAGLGDLIVSTSCSGSFCGNSSSGIYFVGHAGIRYFWKPTVALFADAGAGYGTLHAGIMFELKAGQ
jgi:hypothetical protein